MTPFSQATRKDAPRLRHFKMDRRPKDRRGPWSPDRRRLIDLSILTSTAALVALLVGVGGAVPSSLPGFAALFLAALGVGAYLTRELPDASPEERTLMLLRLGGLTLAAVVVGRLFLSYRWPTYLIPLPLLSAVTSIAYGRRLALLHAWPSCAAVAIAVARWQGQSEPLLDVAFLFTMGTGATVMVFLCERIQSRGTLLQAGLLAGVIVVFAAFSARSLFELPSLQQSVTQLQAARTARADIEARLEEAPDAERAPLIAARQDAVRAVWAQYVDLIRHPFWGLLNCAFSGFLLFEILPWIERFFGVVTRLHLIELADLNQPLLKQLNMQAPGSYHHSQMVAMLSEAAAEEVGADTLLVRVGAYYHDIGKMAKPRYFTENNPESPEIHGLLSPTLSTLVIHAHVKDGLELGRAVGLPLPVLAFIPEHHGTTACEFFYRQAVDLARERGEPVPEKAMFRYPGPRPRSRETSIVLIADSVEAATRSLDKPSPARIRALVHEIIIDKLLDHQFADSPLSLGELGTIEDAMVRKLTWMHHARIKYPKKIEDRQQAKLKDLDRQRQGEQEEV